LTHPRSETKRHHKPKGVVKAEQERGRTRLTISLSQKSVDAWKEIRQVTDADSDSEVFRNALRLYLSLLRAHQNGKTMFIKDKAGKTEPVNLFFSVS